MNFCVFSLIGVLVFLMAKQNTERIYTFMLLIISSVYLYSVLPAIHIPYMVDDIDYLDKMVSSIRDNTEWGWIFSAHNEHVIPIMKYLYLFSYKNFWLYTEFFHLLTFLVTIGVIVVLYHLLKLLKVSSNGALLGCSIFAASNLFDRAVFIFTDAHILYCLLGVLLVFFAQYKNALRPNWIWRVVWMLSFLLSMLTFALGMFMIFYVIAFHFLCIPKDVRKNDKSLLVYYVMGSLIGIVVYAMNVHNIFFSEHYIGRGGSLDKIANYSQSFYYLCRFLLFSVIPMLLSFQYFSFGYFYGAIFIIKNYSNKIDWNKIWFFVFVGLFSTLIIFIFRTSWGEHRLWLPRYYVFPVMLLAVCYAFFADVYLKESNQFVEKTKTMVVVMLCFVMVAIGALDRYDNAVAIHAESKELQILFVSLNKNVSAYVNHAYKGIPIDIKDNNIYGEARVLRYSVRKLSFLAKFILSDEVFKKIVWTDTKTDEKFMNYLHNNKQEWLFDILK
ncbi:MAG: hypothetical protein HQL25_04920 [Candidatus Omnitrophica bacterium]|nr:hypothetical protein [Candidatus Omnitrophota bacterium]